MTRTTCKKALLHSAGFFRIQQLTGAHSIFGKSLVHHVVQRSSHPGIERQEKASLWLQIKIPGQERPCDIQDDSLDAVSPVRM